MSTIKGGKKKRRGKNINTVAKPFAEPTEGQYFAKALKPLGSLKVQLEVYFYEIKEEDKKKRPEDQRISFRKQEMIGNVRGSMRKREYVNPGDIVLVSERGFTKDSKIVDIVMKYPNSHHSIVKKHRFCPQDIMFNQSNEGDGINFMDDDEEFSDEDLDINTSLDYTRTKTVKKKNKNENYMAGIDLPSFDDEFEEAEESSGKRETDIFGNFI